MNKRTLPHSIIAALLLCLSPALAAEPGEERPLSVSFSAGVEYDSNVSVLQLDRASGEGDVATLIDFGLDLEQDLASRLELKLGYDFSQTLYQEFDAFDLRTHRGSGELALDLGAFDTGLAYQYADAALDGEGFLVLERTAPYLSRLFGKTLLLRLEYARSEKEFEADPSRSATSDALSLDAFVFFDGARQYVIFGFQDLQDDAADDRFDHDGRRLKFQYSRRIGDGRGTRFKLGVRHESRDYDLSALPLGPPRMDDRFGFEAEVEWPFAGEWFVRSQYRYNDNRSNLSDADFDEHLLSLQIGARY